MEKEKEKITHYYGYLLTNKGYKVEFDFLENEVDDWLWAFINDCQWILEDDDLIWCGYENPIKVLANTVIGVYWDDYEKDKD